MASLAKNGTELARITIKTPAKGDCNESQTDYSFRSNGAVLRKMTVVFPERQYDQRHSYGWNLVERPNRSRTEESMLEYALATFDSLGVHRPESTVTMTTPHPTRVTRTGNPVQIKR